MVKIRATCLAALSLVLGGCNRLKPQDMALQQISAPVYQGTPQLYAEGDEVSIQFRPGDCAKTECVEFKGRGWRALPKRSLQNLPLLAIGEATGSEYSEGLWRSVAPGRAVLLNASAARQRIDAGYLDGLRIGLIDGTRRTYITVYVIPFVSPRPMRLNHLGDGRAVTQVDADVAVHGGKAWLLQRNPDGSGNLVDLFAILSRPAPIHCLPGLALDTTQWAGPVEKALSPNLFISRDIDIATDKVRRDAIMAACPNDVI